MSLISLTTAIQFSDTLLIYFQIVPWAKQRFKRPPPLLIAENIVGSGQENARSLSSKTLQYVLIRLMGLESSLKLRL